MNIVSLKIPEIKVITPDKFGDERGVFSETYNRKTYSEMGINSNFVQDNYSLSSEIGVLRGLHFQKPPFAQDKLVQVLKGRILDVVVDIRPSSSTYRQWVSAELCQENWAQIFVPKGFAHGFVTLEACTEVIYKVSNYYNPASEGSIRWDDRDIQIDWPIPVGQMTLSAKDREAPLMIEIENELKVIEGEW